MIQNIIAVNSIHFNSIKFKIFALLLGPSQSNLSDDEKDIINKKRITSSSSSSTYRSGINVVDRSGSRFVIAKIIK